MINVLIAVLSVTVIGALCAVLLVLAAKYMHVPEDERFPKVRACLPGANCGACGYTGCDGYAKALIENPDVRSNLCIPGGDATAAELARVLGRAVEDVEEQVAVVCCRGDCSATQNKYAYEGMQTCAAAAALFGGPGSCSYGCMGFGDCAGVCPVDAICLNDGIAHVDPRVCIGCGMCVRTCPHHIIHMVPAVSRVVVLCQSHDKGAVTRKNCTNGCIGCMKCEKACPSDAVHVKDGLAEIDQRKCTHCEACYAACPTGAIARFVGGGAPQAPEQQ